MFAAPSTMMAFASLRSLCARGFFGTLDAGIALVRVGACWARQAAAANQMLPGLATGASLRSLSAERVFGTLDADLAVLREGACWARQAAATHQVLPGLADCTQNIFTVSAILRTSVPWRPKLHLACVKETTLKYQ